MNAKRRYRRRRRARLAAQVFGVKTEYGFQVGTRSQLCRHYPRRMLRPRSELPPVVMKEPIIGRHEFMTFIRNAGTGIRQPSGS